MTSVSSNGCSTGELCRRGLGARPLSHCVDAGDCSIGSAARRPIDDPNDAPDTVNSRRRAFYKRCAAIIADISHAEEEMRARGAGPTGVLRISAPISFGRRRIAPLVQAFQREHPALSVQLHLTGSSDDLELRECDLAIRVGASEQGDSMTRPRLICASSDVWSIRRSWRGIAASS